MIKYILTLLVLGPLVSFSQTLDGNVKDMEDLPLVGASVYWLGTTHGTSTNTEGKFEISLEGITDKRLIVSFVGYETDTIHISKQTFIEANLRESNVLGRVEITSEQKGTYISSIDPIKTDVVTKVELTKAACCDLTGCFDTQGSVQPTTTNIVTNAKELRMLGLSGVYNQVLFDGMPLIQGLTYTYGVSTIPGTLVDNIFISKGANSVLQGYESISGQINIELKEPDETDKVLLNVYSNNFFEKQINANYAKKWNKWSTIVAAHTTQPSSKFDRDEDTFLDLPLLSRYSIYNKWKVGNQDKWGWHSRIGLRYVNENRTGGQFDFNPTTDQGSMINYGQTMKFSQPELYTKTGYRFNDKHHVVLLASAFQHDQLSYFGITRFKAIQQNAYINAQHELNWNKKHVLKSGISYRHLNLNEDVSFNQDLLNRSYDGQYQKLENIPGLFAENTFNWMDNRLTAVTGIRADNHNKFGWIVTPRGLIKYNFNENLTGRISAGTGWRTINLFSENVNLLASSRDVIISSDLRPEQAINYGSNLTYNIYREKVESQISLDFYRTQFQNQIFPDYDTDPTKAFVQNFNGTSISNGFQAQIRLEFVEKIETKIIYNYLEVYRVISGNKVDLPFNSKHRVTSTISYKPLSKKWHFDSNIHWYGKQRLANTQANPSEYQVPNYSDDFFVINAQFTKTWKKLDVYIGCENLLDFRQLRPIVGWQDPFGQYFDTSSVWGPTRGREIYLGLRWKIE